MKYISSNYIIVQWQIKTVGQQYRNAAAGVTDQKRWMNRPLRSFGSNHVDFGGMSIPASATDRSSSIEVGYMENAIPSEASAASSSAPESADTSDKPDARIGLSGRLCRKQAPGYDPAGLTHPDPLQDHQTSVREK